MVPDRSSEYWQQVFNEAVEKLITDVEARTGEPLKDSQKMGLYNSGSFMFLEAMADGFYMAKTDEDIQRWLQQIDSFNR